MPATPTRTAFIIEAKAAKSFVRRVKGFVSKDAGRLILCGVHLFEKNGGLHVEATDSYKLIQFSLDIVAPAEGFNVIVPFKFLESSLKTGTQTIQLSFDEDTVTVNNDGATISSNLTQGTYPNVGQILDKPIPADEQKLGAFDPVRMKDLATALVEWSKDGASIQIVQIHDLKPLIVSMNRDHAGSAAIMPVRRP